MLKSPPKGFEAIVQQHFLLKRENTLGIVDIWLKEASTSDTTGHHSSLLKLVNELKKELIKLGPSPGDTKSASETHESGSPKKAEDEGKEVTGMCRLSVDRYVTPIQNPSGWRNISAHL